MGKELTTPTERTNEKSEISEEIHETIDISPFIKDSPIQKKIEESELSQEETSIEEWPTLKPEALHEYVGRFVKAATEYSEADPAAVVTTFLTRFAVECGPFLHLMVGDSKHFARIFSVIVGASSKARKGTSAKPVKRLFEFDSDTYDFTEAKYNGWSPAKTSPGPLSSGEGIVHAVRDPIEQWNVKKARNELTDPGVKDKRLFILDEELASALSSMKREGNNLSARLRCLWDDGSADIMTKGAKAKTTNAHIGITFHITIQELHQKLDETEAFNGFANRFLFCCARRTRMVPFPQPMDPKTFESLQKEMAEILSEVYTFTELILSAEAKLLWAEVYSDLTRGHSGLVGAVINRAEAQVLRLSMLYALIDRNNIIEPVHLKAALALWEYYQASAKFIFGNRESNPHSRRIMAALESGPKSMTDLYKIFGNQISRKNLDEAVQELVAQNKVEIFKIRTGGRPKTMIRKVDQREAKPVQPEKPKLNTDF